jgi:hypothetical protein
MLSHASTAPPEAELRIEPGQPSLASVANATPAEPEPGIPIGRGAPIVESIRHAATWKGSYDWAFVKFHDSDDRCLRMTSTRHDKPEVSLTFSRQVAWDGLDAHVEFLLGTGPSNLDVDKARSLYKELRAVLSARRQDPAPSMRGKVDPSRFEPR